MEIRGRARGGSLLPHVGSKDQIIRLVTRRGGKCLSPHCVLTSSGPGTFISLCKHHHRASSQPFLSSEVKFFTQGTTTDCPKPTPPLPLATSIPTALLRHSFQISPKKEYILSVYSIHPGSLEK